MCRVDHPHHVSSVLQATAVPSNLGLTTISGIHTNPDPAELVSMFAGTNINNCVFQFSQNSVHGMPSSMTAITDKTLMIKNKLDKQFRICTDSFGIQTFFISLS